jgi:hypothetical protein
MPPTPFLVVEQDDTGRLRITAPVWTTPIQPDVTFLSFVIEHGQRGLVREQNILCKEGFFQ